MNADLDKLCRACLSKKGHTQHVFTIKIRALIESCSSLTFSEGDNLPQKICDNCYRRLLNSFAFKSMIQRNDKILRGLYNNKIESSKDETEKRKKIELVNKTHALINSDPPPLVPINFKISKPNVTSNSFGTLRQESFGTPTQLLSHVPSSISSSQVAVVKKRHKCHACDKRYSHSGSLRLHLYVHTGEKPHQCPICGKRFVRWAAVTSHMATHSGQKAYVCKICGRGFKIRSNMERHKILHTGVAAYCCSFCGKTFTQSNNLTVHMQTHHTNERMHLCNICGKQFVSPSRLKRHIQIHNRIA